MMRWFWSAPWGCRAGACWVADCDATVLIILGGSGIGRENSGVQAVLPSPSAVASLLFRINCGAISSDLFESELFAGSGVGESVLLGVMSRYTNADVVVGLIGERDGGSIMAFCTVLAESDNQNDHHRECGLSTTRLGRSANENVLVRRARSSNWMTWY